MTRTITKSKGQEALEAILPVLNDVKQFEIKKYPVRSNWASKMGHSCERYLYHLRHDWDQAEDKDWKGVGILGNLLADWWVRDMSAKGFSIIHEQLALSDEMVKKYNIGGRIDCRISWRGGRPLLAEIKTMKENYYDAINSYEDMVDSEAEWIRGYPAQIQLYLLSQDEEAGLFVLINKSTLEWKVIPVYLDFPYCEWILQRADKVNKANNAGEPPARIPYGQTCRRCEFKTICLPDIINEGLDLIDNEHLEAILKERDTLEADADRWLELDKEAKEIAKRVGKDFIVGVSYKVEFRNSIQKRVDLKALPPEIKLQYEKETPVQKITFVPLGGKK